MNRRIGSIMQSVTGLWQVMAGAPENCGTASCACGFSRALELSARQASIMHAEPATAAVSDALTEYQCSRARPTIT